jgi:hypothetical protein
MQRALGWLSRTKDAVVNNAKAQWNERREIAIQTVIAINTFCIYKLLEDHAIRFTMVCNCASAYLSLSQHHASPQLS